MDSLYLAAQAQALAVRRSRTGNPRQVPSESLLDCKPSNLACHYQDRRDPGGHRIRSCSDLAIYLQQQKHPASQPEFFVFFGFFKVFHEYTLEECFQNLDPQLGVIVIGAEITRIGAIVIGA